MLDFETVLDIPDREESTSWIRTIGSKDRVSRARRFLEFQLHRINHDDVLPSIHTIRQKCGIGLSQVQMLLGELEDRGLVERRDRSGVFKVVICLTCFS